MLISFFNRKQNKHTMKTLFTLSLLFLAAIVFAQTTELPRTEFNINLSESILSIKPGETKQVTVSIVRSKYYAREKAKLGFLSSLPKGITATYEPSEGNFESAVITIVAASDATIGVYQLAPSATLNTKRKGTLLKLTVGTDQIAAK